MRWMTAFVEPPRHWMIRKALRNAAGVRKREAFAPSFASATARMPEYSA